MIGMHCNRNRRPCELFRASGGFFLFLITDMFCSAGIEQSEDMKRFIWYVGLLIVIPGT